MIGLLSGVLFGLFVGLDLLLVGLLRLDSPLVVVLPMLGGAAGIALGVWAPVRVPDRLRRADDDPPGPPVEVLADPDRPWL